MTTDAINSLFGKEATSLADFSQRHYTPSINIGKTFASKSLGVPFDVKPSPSWHDDNHVGRANRERPSVDTHNFKKAIEKHVEEMEFMTKEWSKHVGRKLASQLGRSADKIILQSLDLQSSNEDFTKGTANFVIADSFGVMSQSPKGTHTKPKTKYKMQNPNENAATQALARDLVSNTEAYEKADALVASILGKLDDQKAETVKVLDEKQAEVSAAYEAYQALSKEYDELREDRHKEKSEIAGELEEAKVERRRFVDALESSKAGIAAIHRAASEPVDITVGNRAVRSSSDGYGDTSVTVSTPTKVTKAAAA